MNRRGITLLEVLFAFFVMMIGMLSIASLIPVGKTQLQKAANADRSGAIGTAVLHQIASRDLMRPQLWSWPNGTDIPGPPVYCFTIDPLGAGVHGADVFPLTVDAGPTMPRITFWPDSYWDTFIPPPPVAQRPALRAALGRSLVTGDDDAVFTIPEDDGRPVRTHDAGPDGLWGYPGVDDDGNGTVDDAAEAGMAGEVGIDDDGNGLVDDPLELGDDIPNSQGGYSWMITAVPNSAELVAGVAGPTAPYPPMRNYTLQVAVFHKRVPAILTDVSGVPLASTKDQTQSERRCYFHLANNLAADGELQHPTAAEEATGGEEYFKLNVNNWIMLAGERPNDAFGNAQPPVFFWYRIAALGQYHESPYGGHRRLATLSGTDFQFVDGAGTPLFLDADGSAATGYSLHAILVTGVAGVFQKTVTFEQWPQQ